LVSFKKVLFKGTPLGGGKKKIIFGVKQKPTPKGGAFEIVPRKRAKTEKTG